MRKKTTTKPKATPKHNPARGKRIRDARLAAGLTVRDVSVAVGVDKSTIGRWESGEIAPRDHSERLAEVLRTTDVHIFYGQAVAPELMEFEASLRGTPEAALAKPWVLQNLRRLRLEAPTVATYRRMFFALLAEGPRDKDAP